LIGFATLTAVVIEHRLDGIDQVARTLVQRPSYPLLRPSMEAASFLGGEPGEIAIVCLASAVLWRRRRRWGLALPMVMAGAGMLQLVAKWAVDRPRPNLDPWGFPSAHVLTVVVLFGYLAYVLGTSRTRRSVSVAIWTAIVGTVAYSRMYLDAHWFSDVLGGFSIGLAYLLAVVWVVGSLPALWEARAAPAATGAEGHPTADGVVAATAGS
jgi:undecaprenyl-diphosphatase